MFELFICHATPDAPLAAAIAARLDRGTGVNPSLLDCGAAPAKTLLDAWDSGLSSSAILLLLSPHSVPPALSRAARQPVLDHFEGNHQPPLATLLVRDCPHPPVLHRRSFFDARSEPARALRALEAWVVRHAGAEAPPAAVRTRAPAPLP